MRGLCAILFECVVENVQENKEKQPMLSAGTLQPGLSIRRLQNDYWRNKK